MKRILILIIALAALESRAGIVGWFTSEARDWQFIQKSGGIKLGAPLELNGKRVLPVEYWPEGNSGLMVRKVELKKGSGSKLVLRIFTQLVENDSHPARIHNVDLSGLGAGEYEVYYETAGDAKKLLGRINMPGKE